MQGFGRGIICCGDFRLQMIKKEVLFNTKFDSPRWFSSKVLYLQAIKQIIISITNIFNQIKSKFIKHKIVKIDKKLHENKCIQRKISWYKLRLNWFYG